MTFVFNGGPGSASIWLHFGLVGPRLIDIPSDASDPGGPPYRLRDNPWTILRATDLVFVDPVGTGYSKALGEHKNAEFWGYDQDADSVAEFIRTFITTHNRWNSPKYILGESYGGIRAPSVPGAAASRLNVGLNGIILVSPALNMGSWPLSSPAATTCRMPPTCRRWRRTPHYHNEASRLPVPSLERCLRR